MLWYWIILWLASVCEVGWVSGLKHANSAIEWGFTIVGVIVSFGGLIIVSKVIPVGTVYAVFTGLGAAGTVFAESVIFGAAFEGRKIVLLIILVIGVAGLKFTTSSNTRDIEEV